MKEVPIKKFVITMKVNREIERERESWMTLQEERELT